MPTYDYACKACGKEFEVLHGMKEQPRVACPACGGAQTARLLTGGAGLIFKGSGFYITDYKNGAPKDAAAPAAKDAGGEKTAAATPEKGKTDKPGSGGGGADAPAAKADAPAKCASAPAATSATAE